MEVAGRCAHRGAVLSWEWVLGAAEQLLFVAGGGANVVLSGTRVVALAGRKSIRSGSPFACDRSPSARWFSAYESQGLWERAKKLRELQKTLSLLAGNRSCARSRTCDSRDERAVP